MSPLTSARAGCSSLPRDADRSARIALITLTAINLLNYLDRYLIAGIVAPLKEHFGARDADIGLLTSVFLLVYMCASPVFGLLARTMSRTMLLGTGVIIWSIATIGSGLVNTLTQLLIARALVGVGEAAYATVGPALLADHYRPAKRAAMLSIFYAAIPVGTALSYIASGLISGVWGWRAVFLAGGIPGMFLGVLCVWLRDPPRGQFDDAPPTARSTDARASAARLRESIAFLWRSRDFLVATSGYALFTFAFGALAVWMPYFLQSVRGWSEGASTTLFGIVIVSTGFAGTLGGGFIAKRLGGESHTSMRICTICMLIAAPAAFVALVSTTDWIIVAALIVSSTFSFATQGPVNAVIINSVGSSLRALAIGASVLVIHLLGDVPSPWIVGTISQSTSASGGGLGLGLTVVPAAMLLAAVAWSFGWRR